MAEPGHVELRKGRRASIIAPGADLSVPVIEQMIWERHAARQNGAYVEADRIRDKLNNMGVTLRDGAGWIEWDVRFDALLSSDEVSRVNAHTREVMGRKSAVLRAEYATRPKTRLICLFHWRGVWVHWLLRRYVDPRLSCKPVTGLGIEHLSPKRHVRLLVSWRPVIMKCLV